MTKQQLINEMIKVQVEIHNALDELKLLDAEKISLLSMAREHGVDLPAELQTKMQVSLDKMKEWSGKLRSLRIRSDELKSKMDFEIANARGE